MANRQTQLETRVDLLANKTVPDLREEVFDKTREIEAVVQDQGTSIDYLKDELAKYKQSNDAVVADHDSQLGEYGTKLTDHADRIAKLEQELELLKSMGAPSGDGDNSNVLDALSKMIKNLEDKLSGRIEAIEEQLKNFVTKPEFEAAVVDLDDRKADRSELEDRFAKLKSLIDGIKIPEPTTTIVKETVVQEA